MGDPTLIDEMLRNVIENGVKYNRLNGEVRVSVALVSGKARVAVRDTGIGIPDVYKRQMCGASVTRSRAARA